MDELPEDLGEVIRKTGELKENYTLEDVTGRARRVLRWAVARGTTAMRAHPDVDPIAKLLGVEALLELKQEFAGYVDLQVVAFPQESIYKAPGTLELMEEGMRLGCEVVGGCPYNEESIEETRRHLRTVFA